MSEESIVVTIGKGPYARWLHRLPVGELTGAQILQALGAPHWGSLSIKRGNGYEPIEREKVYRVPEDIPAETHFNSSW